MARILNRIASGFEYSGYQLEKLDYYAKTEGLTPLQMSIILSEMENDFIDVKTKFKLLSCLIPRDKIPEEIFINMAWFLINHHISIKLKNEVLKWMIAAYPFMDISCGKFHLLYETFLILLSIPGLRKFLCHLIYIITTKKSVTRRRVSMISKSIIHLGKNQRLGKILQLYYELCPDFFDGQFAATKFEFTNESLGVYFTRMQSRVQLCAIHSNFYQEFKSMRLCSIDCNDMVGVVEETDSFISIDTLNQLHKALSVMEEKNHVKSVLESSLFHIYFATHITRKKRIVFEDYILNYLQLNADDPSCLQSILEIFHQLQCGVPFVSDVVNFLKSETWDLNSDLLTSFIQYEPLCCFERIAPNLEIIREYMRKFGIKIKCKFINLLSNLYINWVLMSEDDEFLCDCSSFYLDESLSEHTEINTINKLGSYIDEVCKDFSFDDHPCLMNEVLLHYMRVSNIHQNYNSGMFIRLLPYEIFILAFYSKNICTLESLCDLMLSYRKELDHMAEVKHPEWKIAKKHYASYLNELKKFLYHTYRKTNKYNLRCPKMVELSQSIDNKLEKKNQLYKLPSMSVLIEEFPLKTELFKFEKCKMFRRKFYRYIEEYGFKSIAKFFSEIDNRL